MANRLVTFGDPGPAGPPGVTTLPNGRGLLGHTEQAFFDVPIAAPSADAWYLQVLRLQAGGSLGWNAMPLLPMPLGAAKATNDGKVLYFDASQGYVLGSLPPKFPTGTDGVIGVAADGTPEVYPYGAAPDGAFARKVGTSLTFSQLFVQNGYVKAAADGSFSYVALGNGLVETAGVLSAKPATGIIVDASGIRIDTSLVATLSGGKLASSQRGFSLVATPTAPIVASTTATTNVSPGSFIQTLTIANVQVGDELVVEFEGEGDGAAFFLLPGIRFIRPNATTAYDQLQTAVTCNNTAGRGYSRVRKFVADAAGTWTVEHRVAKFNAGDTNSTIRQATMQGWHYRP